MSTPANFQGLPSMIDPDDAVMLLIDHQSGLFQLVRDIEQHVLRGHVHGAGQAVAPGQYADVYHRFRARRPERPP